MRARIRVLLYLGTVVVVLGVVTAAAWAAAEPIAASDNAFTGGSGGSAPTYTMNQGDKPFLTNNGPVNMHNVKANQVGPDSGPLFYSTVIAPGQQGPVHGAEYLSAGSYPFICAIHPTEMQGTLVVSSIGTPKPRPTAKLVLRTKTIAKARKKGLLVSVDLSTTAGSASLVAKLGQATIGKAHFNQDPHRPNPQTLLIKLTKAAKGKLRAKKTAKVSVTASILFGAPVTATAKLK